MKRRHWILQTTASGLALAARPWHVRAAEADAVTAEFPALADAALGKATALGASFADFHIMQTDSESLWAREEMVQGVDADSSLGCSVRVLAGGAWGFAAGQDLTREGVARLAEEAIAIAKEQAGWRAEPIEIESLPAHVDTWVAPVKVDPFTVPIEEKAGRLLEINRIALKAGASFCTSSLDQIRERKWLANTHGSRIVQSRIRVNPGFDVTLIDRKRGRFASRASFAPPRGIGYEYFDEYDFAAESALAVQQAREKLAARSVEPGRYDLVIAPSNLWLTIHETVGHPTELDRALGYEANYAGTSFCTPDKLDSLRYASEIVTIRGERTQATGLATIGYDDDGVKTAGKEFDIIQDGVFRNFQTALGQAEKIGREGGSNACSYAAGFESFPIQRMPNISLQPGADPGVTAESLIAGVENGIFVVGRGSWSIDQQRYNFQFTGQVFHRIRHGRLDGMFSDVAYQGNSIEFWNACDGLGGPATYELGGAFNCGKGRPSQLAPVSHGAVPARFRQINVLNTAAESGKNVAAAGKPSNHCCCSGGGLQWT